MTDSPQQWDDILADVLVECGHCHGPMSPLPPGSAEPRFECIQHPYAACAAAALSGLVVEEYAARHLLTELARPGSVERLTQALFKHVDDGLLVLEEVAALDTRGDVPTETLEAHRRELRSRIRVAQRYMDEDAFSRRWMAAWWNRAGTHRKRQLCRLLFNKIELRPGAAPSPASLSDDRITLHWRRPATAPEQRDDV